MADKFDESDRCSRHVGKRFQAIVLNSLGSAMLAFVVACSGCSLVKSTKDGFANLLSPSGTGLSSRDNGSGTRDDIDFGQSNPNRLVFSDFAPSEISTTVRTRLSGEDRTAAEKQFREAQMTYSQAIDLWDQDKESAEAHTQFLKAARQFRLAAASWKDSALEQDSLFMIGESQFFAHQYVLANRAYEQLVSRYPGTQQMDLVQNRRYNIARYWLESARKQSRWSVNLTDDKRPMNDMAGHARRILHNIRLDDPTGKIADDATFALGGAYLESARYEDAADAYEDLRRTYPGSKHQFQAHLYELKARLACYRGADYDGTQLVKADKILQALTTQFPDKIAKQREYLDQEASNIRNLLAERDFTLGRYFEWRGENRAAVLYYENVVKEFPETEKADLAMNRAREIEGLPAAPGTQLAWFVGLFPQPRATKPLISTGNDATVLR